MGFENDLPVSIKDCNFSDRETCSCFKSVPGISPYSAQFSKAEEKVIQNFSLKKEEEALLCFQNEVTLSACLGP